MVINEEVLLKIQEKYAMDVISMSEAALASSDTSQTAGGGGWGGAGSAAGITGATVDSSEARNWLLR